MYGCITMESMPPWTVKVSRLVFGAVLATWSAGVAQADPAAAACETDQRCEALRAFFQRHGSPLARTATVFLAAADRHGLDWRLLPAISIVETGGGRHGRKGNVFGWNSGRTRFKTIEAGIEFVAQRLARSPIYAGRTAMGILQKYNPARKVYAERVSQKMMELSPEPVR